MLEAIEYGGSDRPGTINESKTEFVELCLISYITLGEGVLPYISYIGMCRPKGYGPRPS